MLSLEQILTEKHPSGVYRLLSMKPLAAVMETAERSGYFFAHIDGEKVHSEQDFMREIATTLRFPDYFSANWDALADCLIDMSWIGARKYVVYFSNPEQFAAADSEAFGIAIAILDSVAKERSDRSPMFLLLRGNNDMVINQWCGIESMKN
jgi:RNAse (barnase) inhibitor barstar